jgi:hypothetical protein
MACPNCGGFSDGQHDQQVYCSDCIGPQRELRALKSDREKLIKKKVKWGKDLSPDEKAQVNQLGEEIKEVKKELEELREEADQ